MSVADIEDDTEYAVVLNDEEQYSIWPVDRPLPLGWRAEGMRGPKQDCLTYIDETSTDITPRSVREWLSGRRAQ